MATESSASSVAWAAIAAGALAAVSLSVILMALGSGFGLASVSPWPYSGASVTTFAVMSAIWLIVIQWLSSALGGYLTGRLRTRWAGVHDHEVYFRDTANGFLAWAVATIVGVAVVASAASSVLGGAARSAAAAVSGAAAQGTPLGTGSTQAGATDASAYLVDSLFRSDGSADAAPPDVRAEAGRILVNGLKAGDVSPADKGFLANIVATRTGLSQADAATRVNDVIAQAKDAEQKAREAADAARKAAASLSIFTALAMLIGAFIASAAGALGGHHRDKWIAQLAAR